MGYVLERFIKTELMKLLGKNSPQTSDRSFNLNHELSGEIGHNRDLFQLNKAWSPSRADQNLLTDLKWWKGATTGLKFSTKWQEKI